MKSSHHSVARVSFFSDMMRPPPETAPERRNYRSGCSVTRNSMLVRHFFSLPSTISMASADGTPLTALRSSHTLLNSSGCSSSSSLRVPDFSMLMAG